jgi:integrase
MRRNVRGRGGLHKLTHQTCIKAPIGAKPYKLSDGGGLYLAVLPSGVKSWRMRFAFEGSPSIVALGVFPTTSCTIARSKAEDVRRKIAAGIHPVMQRREARAKRKSPTLEVLGREWHTLMSKSKKWVPRHADNVIASLERDVFPKFGKRPVAEISSAEVLECVQPVADRARATADRIQQRVRAILDYAALKGHITTGNAASVRLTEVLPDRKSNHFEPVPLAALPGLLDELESARGKVDLNVRLALRFLIYTVGRSSEIRRASWDQIDESENIWRVPVEHMKTRLGDHWVPLSEEALAVLREAKQLSTGSALVFPSIMRPGQPLSDVTLSKALHTLTPVGVPHGIRTTFSSWAHDQPGRDSRTIEMCLSHVDKDKVRGVYDASLRIEERRELLASWARIVRGKIA